MQSSPPPSAASFLAVRLAIALGVALRLLSLNGELWLDEAWSVLLLQQANSPVDILFSIRHDNNHLLNSLWLWFLGPRAPEWLMRLPAVIFSAVTLLLVSHASKRVAPGLQGAVWCLLVAVSYPFVLLGSEARGYALMLMCAVGCFSLALRLGDKGAGVTRALAFFVLATLGLLAHASFAVFLVPAVAWILAQRSRTGALPELAVSAASTAAPLATSVAAWWMFYRGAEVGGGPIAPYVQVALSAVSVTLGGGELSALTPEASALAAAAALGAIVAAIAELIAWRRQGDRAAGLVALVIAAPVVAVAVSQPPFIVARYFLCALLFLLLLVARFLGRLARQGVIGRAVATALLALVAWGSLSHDNALIEQGRSCFLSLAAQAGGSAAVVTLGGDMDNRNETRLAYGKLRTNVLQSIVYVHEFSTAGSPPTAVVREWSDQAAQVPREFASSSGVSYELVRSCRAALLEGGQAGLYLKRGVKAP